MGVTKKAKLISEWSTYGDKEFRYEGNPRTARYLIIGTMQQPGGADQYVMEGVYTDLIPMIESKQIKVHVDLYSEPKIVLEMEGKMVPHNANVEILREDTLALLDEQTPIVSNQIRALVELRNNAYSQIVLGKATKMLRSILSDGLDAKLNYDFIRLVLKEKYVDTEPEDSLGQELRSMDKDELISVYGGLLEKYYTKAVRIEPMKTMVENGVSVEEIEEALKDEIARRFFEGSIS
ncbi:MAG: hypothetical protein ACI4FX_03250 [Agathobacter sp.]